MSLKAVRGFDPSNAAITGGVIGGRSVVDVGNSDQRAALAVRSTGTFPAEGFDRPEGTLLNGITTVTGHTLSISGTAYASVQVNNNAMASPNGNMYAGLTHSSLVTRVSGAFSFTAADAGQQAVIMFNGSTNNTDLTKLIHLELYPTTWSLKVTNTGPGGLSAPTYTERSGRRPVVNWLRALPTDGSPVPIAMEYTQGASSSQDIITLFLPDGRIIDCSGDARIRDVMGTAYHGTWQIGSGASATRWNAISLGDNRARTLAALGSSARRADLAPLCDMSATYKRGLGVTFTPTAAGWYTVATGVAASTNNNALTGTLRILGSDNLNRQSFAELFVNCFYVNAPRIYTIKDGFGSYGGEHITKVRLSRDSGGTNYQLDVYIATYVSVNDVVTVEFEGLGAMVSSPVVGATPLAVSREQVIHDLTKTVANNGSTSDYTLTPGIDYQYQTLSGNYAANINVSLDDTKAVADDQFHLTRITGWTNSAVIKNVSDGSTVVTLAPGTTARVGIASGKFTLLSKGTA